MPAKKLLGLLPTLQAVTLLKEMKAKKPKVTKIVKTGLKNIVGINLIKIESDLISGL